MGSFSPNAVSFNRNIADLLPEQLRHRGDNIVSGFRNVEEADFLASQLEANGQTVWIVNLGRERPGRRWRKKITPLSELSFSLPIDLAQHRTPYSTPTAFHSILIFGGTESRSASVCLVLLDLLEVYASGFLPYQVDYREVRAVKPSATSVRSLRGVQ